MCFSSGGSKSGSGSSTGTAPPGTGLAPPKAQTSAATPSPSVLTGQGTAQPADNRYTINGTGRA